MSYIEKSPWVIHFEGSGCRGCGMEIKACFAPKYDLERFGIKRTDNPKHADVLLITGIVDEDNKERLKALYEQMVPPKTVVAVGACACTGGIFEGYGEVLGSADNSVPVDIFVPGCAVRPEAVTDGIFKSFETEAAEEAKDGAAEDTLPEKNSEDTEENIKDKDAETPECGESSSAEKEEKKSENRQDEGIAYVKESYDDEKNEGTFSDGKCSDENEDTKTPEAAEDEKEEKKDE